MIFIDLFEYLPPYLLASKTKFQAKLRAHFLMRSDTIEGAHDEQVGFPSRCREPCLFNGLTP